MLAAPWGLATLDHQPPLLKLTLCFTRMLAAKHSFAIPCRKHIPLRSKANLDLGTILARLPFLSSPLSHQVEC